MLLENNLYCKTHQRTFDYQLDYKTSNKLVKLVDNKLVDKI